MRAFLIARSRRLAIVLAALVGLGVTVAATPASATEAGSGHLSPPTYLALGDSVPFGYRGNESPAVYAHAENFVGYPEIVAQQAHLRLINASCPGETTDSFIDPTAQSHGCENRVNPNGGAPLPGGYRTNYPLHVQYSSPTESQLQFALDVLQQKSNNVRLVTLMVGANDAFVCQETTADKCTSQAELARLAAHVRANLDYILRALRERGRYDGQIVVVTYYALDYSAPSVVGTAILDQAMAAAAAANGDTPASGFLAFLPVAELKGGGNSIKAGLVLPNDVHPTPEGHQLLADAVLSVLGSAAVGCSGDGAGRMSWSEARQFVRSRKPLVTENTGG